MVTGQRYIALDFHPGTEIVRRAKDDRYAEIPTVPTAMQEVQAQLASFIDSLTTIPLRQTVEEMRATMASIHQLVEGGEVQATVSSMHAAMVSLERITGDLDGRVGPFVDSLSATTVATRLTLEQAEATLQRMETMIDGTEMTQYEVALTLREMGKAAASLGSLADLLQRHPEALVIGKGGSE
jgi:paraquat-inducible protein B